MSEALRRLPSIAPLVERALRFFSYVPLLALSAIVSLAKLMIYARLVSADEYGAISQMFLIGNTFGIVGSLGFYLLGLRELPGLHVRRREFAMAMLLTQSVVVSTATTLAAGLILMPFVESGAPSTKIGGLGVAVGLFYAWTQLCFQIATTDSRSRLEMTRYSADLAFRSVVTTAAGVVVILLGRHARVVVFAESIVTLAAFLWVGAGIVGRAKMTAWTLIRKATRRLKVAAWRPALILMLGSLLSFLTSAADRWLAATSLDLQQFGYYAFAWTSIAAAQTFQFLINASLFPLIGRRYWAKSARDAFRLTAALSLGLAGGGALAAAASAPFVGMVVARFFPHQAGAVALIEPLLIAAVLRVADFWSSFLLVVRRETLLLKLQIAVLAVVGLAFAVATLASGRPPTAMSLAWLAVGLAAANFVLCGGAAWAYRGAPRL
jgi:O-antigen/teichoic acid export membrane protein